MTRQEEILDAAVGLADERGLAAVSMRSVADLVGVTPMALYPYVGSKAALLDGMVGRLLRQVVPGQGEERDQAGLTWQEKLGTIGRSARQLAARHPWAAPLVFSVPALTLDSRRLIDLIFAAMLEAGVQPAEVPRLERMVSTFLLGYTASEAGGRFAADREAQGRAGRLPQADLPAHSRLADALAAPVDWDAEFEADLDDLELLIEAVARRATASVSSDAGQ
jgi:AcrR family transcriptional regulator